LKRCPNKLEQTPGIDVHLALSQMPGGKDDGGPEITIRSEK
jgi:hypothetical protein